MISKSNNHKIKKKKKSIQGATMKIKKKNHITSIRKLFTHIYNKGIMAQSIKGGGLC